MLQVETLLSLRGPPRLLAALASRPTLTPVEVFRLRFRDAMEPTPDIDGFFDPVPFPALLPFTLPLFFVPPAPGLAPLLDRTVSVL